MNWKTPAVGAVAFLAGAVIFGASGGSETIAPVTVASPAPSVTVTKTLEPAPATTKVVTKEVTPPICLEALDLSAEVVNIAAEMFEALENLDSDRFEELTAELESKQSTAERVFPGCRELAK